MNLNLSHNKEEIVELFGGQEDDVGNQWFIGEPIDVFFDYEKIGVWQQDEAEQAAQFGQKPGEIKVRDVNNDGTIGGYDRVILGQEMPSWQGGITLRTCHPSRVQTLSIPSTGIPGLIKTVILSESGLLGWVIISPLKSFKM